MKTNSMWYLGLFILIYLFSCIFCTTILFILGVPITKYHWLIAMVNTIILMFLITQIKLRDFIKIFIVSILIIGLILLLSYGVYDFSWDGNTYHKTTIGMLKNGWNPVWLSFDDAAKLSGIVDQRDYPLWFDHYPKASWILSAVFYSMSDSIQTGKSYTMLSMIGMGLILYTLLLDTKYFKKYQALIIAFLSVVNCITLPQMQSFYNDGLLSVLLIGIVGVLTYAFFIDEGLYVRQVKFLIFIIINIALNLKFSAIIYFGIFCGMFYILQICFSQNKIKVFKEWTIFYVFTLITTFCITGATSYLRNGLQHNNPLFPMIGPGKIEIMDYNTPEIIKNISKTKQFLFSFLSKVNNNRDLNGIQAEIVLF